MSIAGPNSSSVSSPVLPPSGVTAGPALPPPQGSGSPSADTVAVVGGVTAAGLLGAGVVYWAVTHKSSETKTLRQVKSLNELDTYFQALSPEAKELELHNLIDDIKSADGLIWTKILVAGFTHNNFSPDIEKMFSEKAQQYANSANEKRMFSLIDIMGTKQTDPKKQLEKEIGVNGFLTAIENRKKKDPAWDDEDFRLFCERCVKPTMSEEEYKPIAERLKALPR